jgi:putative SOS response-associated peptidase YedK
LDPAKGNGQALLRPCPDVWLVAYPVSTYVNKPANDDPKCIEPVS